MGNILSRCRTFGVIHDSAYIIMPHFCESSAKVGFRTSGRASEANPMRWDVSVSRWTFTLDNVYIRVIVTSVTHFSSLLPREGLLTAKLHKRKQSKAFFREKLQVLCRETYKC